MVIMVTEKCLTTNDDDVEYYGIRQYKYECKSDNLLDAFTEMEKGFDCDNIFDSNDFFPGECLDSEVIKVEVSLEDE